MDVTPLSEIGAGTVAWKPKKIKVKNCPQSQGASLLGGQRTRMGEKKL